MTLQMAIRSLLELPAAFIAYYCYLFIAICIFQLGVIVSIPVNIDSPTNKLLPYAFSAGIAVQELYGSNLKLSMLRTDYCYLCIPILILNLGIIVFISVSFPCPFNKFLLG